MSLKEDVQKIADFVTEETRNFVLKHNDGKMPTAQEILDKSESFEFPELDRGEVSSSFYCWDKQHVLVFITCWSPHTTVTSKELPADQWPPQLAMRLAKSIEIKAPDGTVQKVL